MISAACWGLTRVGPSNSTTRSPTDESSMSSLAVLAWSSVATIGNSLSRGWRKLGTTPVSLAGGMSQKKTSKYHAGLRNVTGIGRVLGSCSRIRNCPKRFGRADFAPIWLRRKGSFRVAALRASLKASAPQTNLFLPLQSVKVLPRCNHGVT